MYVYPTNHHGAQPIFPLEIHSLDSHPQDCEGVCFSFTVCLQAYHSRFLNPPQVVGNMALLPLRTQYKGPAPKDSE